MTKMPVGIATIVLAACLTAAHCGVHPDGISQVSRSQDALGNYQFSYSVSNAEGEQFRNEGTDHLGRVVGSYGLTHADGTHRVVDYVADKGGFRAQVRSNEQGITSSDPADAPIIKTHSEQPLAVAASSQDSAGDVYGRRLKAEISQVAYVDSDEDKQKPLDNSARESRQRIFDDYRPRNPVAYYPDEVSGAPRPPRPPARLPSDTLSASGLRSQAPSADSKPLDVYFPPIDPHTALRRPGYLFPRDRVTDFPSSTTSRRPFIPPYGGFDDDPLPVGRRPGVSVSTVHGGLGSDQFQPPVTSTPAYGAGRYPSDSSAIPRDFVPPHFPSPAIYPGRLPGSLLPLPPLRDHSGAPFAPPSYNGIAGSPNFVLRAVPIPNGIQAVRVDPTTGQVYERLVFPLFLRPDGHAEYDRSILLHNDDVSDEDALRNDNPSYMDIPFRGRPNYRSARNQPFDGTDGNVRQFNNSYDVKSLSTPTAKDFEWIHRQLALVEGFDRNRYPNALRSNNLPFRNIEYSEFDDFDETADEPPIRSNRPYSRVSLTSSALLDRSNGAFSRNPRHGENLTPADTKESISSKLEDSESTVKAAETEPKVSEIEKE